MQDCGSVMQGCAYASAYVILFATKVWSCKLYGDMQIHGEEQIHSHWVCCFPLFFFMWSIHHGILGVDEPYFFCFICHCICFLHHLIYFFYPFLFILPFEGPAGWPTGVDSLQLKTAGSCLFYFFVPSFFLSYSCFRIVNNWVYVELWWSGRDMPCVCYAWFLLFPLFFYSMPLI